MADHLCPWKAYNNANGCNNAAMRHMTLPDIRAPKNVDEFEPYRGWLHGFSDDLACISACDLGVK